MTRANLPRDRAGAPFKKYSFAAIFFFQMSSFPLALSSRSSTTSCLSSTKIGPSRSSFALTATRTSSTSTKLCRRRRCRRKKRRRYDASAEPGWNWLVRGNSRGTGNRNRRRPSIGVKKLFLSLTLLLVWCVSLVSLFSQVSYLFREGQEHLWGERLALLVNIRLDSKGSQLVYLKISDKEEILCNIVNRSPKKPFRDLDAPDPEVGIFDEAIDLSALETFGTDDSRGDVEIQQVRFSKLHQISK